MSFLRICFGAVVLEGYGMTEAACTISTTRAEDLTTGAPGCGGEGGEGRGGVKGGEERCERRGGVRHGGAGAHEEGTTGATGPSVCVSISIVWGYQQMPPPGLEWCPHRQHRLRSLPSSPSPPPPPAGRPRGRAQPRRGDQAGGHPRDGLHRPRQPLPAVGAGGPQGRGGRRHRRRGVAAAGAAEGAVGRRQGQ